MSPHAASGRWYKKIRGHRHYFGPLDDWQTAINRYQDQKDDLYAGRKPRLTPDECVTVRELCNLFLEAKRQRVDTEDLKARTWQDYRQTCKSLIKALGGERVIDDLRPDDFTAISLRLNKDYSAVVGRNLIQRIRTVFKWATDIDLITHPMKFGPDFQRPSKKRERRERREAGQRMFTASLTVPMTSFVP